MGPWGSPIHMGISHIWNHRPIFHINPMPLHTHVRMFSQMSKLAFPYETEWLMGPLTLMVRLVLINRGVLLRVVHYSQCQCHDKGDSNDNVHITSVQKEAIANYDPWITPRHRYILINHRTEMYDNWPIKLCQSSTRKRSLSIFIHNNISKRKKYCLLWLIYHSRFVAYDFDLKEPKHFTSIDVMSLVYTSARITPIPPKWSSSAHIRSSALLTNVSQRTTTYHFGFHQCQIWNTKQQNYEWGIWQNMPSSLKETIF